MLSEKENNDMPQVLQEWMEIVKNKDAQQLISNEIQELEFVLSHLAPLLGQHYLHPPVTDKRDKTTYIRNTNLYLF